MGIMNKSRENLLKVLRMKTATTDRRMILIQMLDIHLLNQTQLLDQWKRNQLMKKLPLLKKVQVRKNEEVQRIIMKRVIATVIITIDITMVMDTITRRVTRKIVIVIVIAIAKNVKTKVKNPIKKDHQTTKVMMTKTKKDMETEVLALLPVLKTKIVCRNPPNLNGNHQKWTKLRLRSEKSQL